MKYRMTGAIEVDADADAAVVRVVNDAGDEIVSMTVPAAVPPQPKPPAPFVGFGAGTTAGQGAEIVKVSNWDDRGPGSLRWACEDRDDPRIVLFDVGGLIQLRDDIHMGGNLYLAGQTAPGAGITVSGGRMRAVRSNGVMQGMRIRPGDSQVGGKFDNRDGVSIGVEGRKVQDWVIDHNSFTWSVDENASCWNAPERISFSNNLIAEALRKSEHPKGAHSMGHLISDGSKFITSTGNAIISNEFRSPTIAKAAEAIEFIGNYVYNYGPHGLIGGKGCKAHVISNVWEAGPNSASREPIRLEEGDGWYLTDNVGAVHVASGSPSSEWVFEGSGFDFLPSAMIKAHVLANAGARFPLDAIDQRILKLDTRFIDKPEEGGGYGAERWTTEHPEQIDDPLAYVNSFLEDRRWP